jgi:hypothetical protein
MTEQNVWDVAEIEMKYWVETAARISNKLFSSLPPHAAR